MGPQLWRNKAAEAHMLKAQGSEVGGGGVEDEGRGNVTREQGVVAEVEVSERGVGWLGGEEEEERGPEKLLWERSRREREGRRAREGEMEPERLQ